MISGSGIDIAVVMYTGPDGKSQVAYNYLSLASGTRRDGVWTASIAVPASTEPGAWTLRGFYMRDLAGHEDGRYPDEHAASCRVVVQ